MKRSEDVCALLSEHLKELHLPTIRRCYEEEARRAESEGLGYERYLLGVVERECEARWANRVERSLRESRLPLDKSLESFEMKRLPRKVAARVQMLLEGGFLDRRENVLAFGNPGSGKTHLVAAIAQELIRRGRRVHFATCQMLVQQLLSAKRDLALARCLKRLGRYEALVIDDIGYVQQSREEMEVLFTLLADRYERASILLTSNLPFSRWDQIFKDPMTTAAAIDRLVHHSVILELNLPSYRLESARRSKGSAEAAGELDEAGAAPEQAKAVTEPGKDAVEPGPGKSVAQAPDQGAQKIESEPGRDAVPAPAKAGAGQARDADRTVSERPRQERAEPEPRVKRENRND